MMSSDPFMLDSFFFILVRAPLKLHTTNQVSGLCDAQRVAQTDDLFDAAGARKSAASQVSMCVVNLWIHLRSVWGSLC